MQNRIYIALMLLLLSTRLLLWTEAQGAAHPMRPPSTCGVSHRNVHAQVSSNHPPTSPRCHLQHVLTHAKSHARCTHTRVPPMSPHDTRCTKVGASTPHTCQTVPQGAGRVDIALRHAEDRAEPVPRVTASAGALHGCNRGARGDAPHRACSRPLYQI